MNIAELKREITNINRLIENGSSGEHRSSENLFQLCSLVYNDSSLFDEFFSCKIYSEQHVILGMYLFICLGIAPIQRIAECIPDHCGGTVSNWDAFIILLYDKLATTYPNQSFINEFLELIRSFCDELQLCELLTYTPMQLLSLEDHAIIDNLLNLDFVLVRARTMEPNQNDMKRYLHLVQKLAQKDYFSAFQAWGQFYYVFEEAYLPKQTTKAGFTARFYNAFLAIPQQLRKARNTEEMELLFHEGQKTLNDAIFSYGWDVLHHLFEINADSENASNARVMGQSWVYKQLPSADQKLADQAIALCLRRQEFSPNRETEKATPQEIITLLHSDSQLGISTWKNLIAAYEATPKRKTKAAYKRLIDDILLPVYRSEQLELQKSKELWTKTPFESFLLLDSPNVIKLVYNDSWLLNFCTKYCTNYGCAVELAVYAKFIGNKEVYLGILNNISNNSNMQIDFAQFIDRVQTRLILCLREAIHIPPSQLPGKYDITRTKEAYEIFRKVVMHLGVQGKVFSYRDASWLFDYANDKGIVWFVEQFDTFFADMDMDLKTNMDLILQDEIVLQSVFSYSKQVDVLKLLWGKIVQGKKHGLFVSAKYALKNRACSHNMELQEFATACMQMRSE